MLVLAILTILCKSGTEAIRPTNILGGLEQHASFSFVRPGLTQTAFAFNGPSSHQSFSSSIGNPFLSRKVQPSVAQALSYRNPGLAFSPTNYGHISPVYTMPTPVPTFYQPQPLDYHQHQALAMTYQQQLQEYQNHHQQEQHQQPLYSEFAPQLSSHPNDVNIHQNLHQVQPSRILAPRSVMSSTQLISNSDSEETQFRDQRTQQHQPNLLGIAYSSAPSVAHVKINGNGYKVDF